MPSHHCPGIGKSMVPWKIPSEILIERALVDRIARDFLNEQQLVANVGRRRVEIVTEECI